MKTLKTTIHRYSFNTSNPEQLAQYNAMKAQIPTKKDGRGEWMNAWGGNHPSRGNISEEIELEITCIFENQWNSATERVFDWYEEYQLQNKSLKRGHWLEITPEMVQVRRETLKCGYCGCHYGPHHDKTPVNGFCAKCLDSSYLKETDLFLLRLVPICDDRKEKQPLTDEEKEMLMPLYIDRQTQGNDSRAAQARKQAREDILNDYEKTTKEATTKRDGLLWLWDHNIPLDNVIYYSHTDKFCFGWRNPLSPDVHSRLLDLISEFPFEYEIKATKAA